MTKLRAAVTRGLATVALVSFAVPLATVPAVAGHESCKAAAEQHLQRLGIDSGDVKSIDMITVPRSLEMGTISGLEVWTSLKSCPGTLVTKMTLSCTVTEDYSRGGCSVPNVRQF